ncbi:hypothetical protein BYT27DRAFT_7221243 [Phlegmacium glaucopus]|nr:hypothetical protein BYT27DRAFT_7221243 [Phlegmacium glaucopus]
MGPSRSKKTKTCEICNNIFDAQGFVSHERSSHVELLNREKELGELVSYVLPSPSFINPQESNFLALAHKSADCDRAQFADPRSQQAGPSNSYGEMLQQIPPPPIPVQYNIDDIKIVYHPNCRKPDKVFHLEDYNSSLPPPTDIPTEENPWRPFQTRTDFDIAELILDTHMNKDQTTDFLKILHKIAGDPTCFTIANRKELNKMWEGARSYHAARFKHNVVSVPYKDEVLNFDMYMRPLWDWCTELLMDPKIVQQFHWNAEKHFKYNGDKFERFIDEPWTADSWWELQSTLPTDGFPFCIIMYADKTKLSSFGTQKGYPVLARCANLPIELRNGEGVEGGRLVGWLPVLEEDSGETGKKGYVDFKRVVWHKAFYEIVESMEKYAELGFALDCGDGIRRKIYLFILIVSADYEEQCTIALIRGINSKFPCPICLVPGNELTNLTDKFALRTTETMKKVHDEAQLLNATEREQLLKDHGLRNVKNVFWSLKGSDIYRALSWDRLHAYHGGLFSDHLLVELKCIVDAMGRQLDQIPRWKDLNHFNSLKKSGEYTDGTKFEDLSKVIIFASHNVVSTTDRGLLLLRLMRSYLELDMYTSLTVHTESTLAAGRAEILVFEELLHEYEAVNPDKNWNFPKAHTHNHVFDDIENKGATRGFNTKPNEKAHRPLKAFYKFHTNFKDVAPQILRCNETDLIAMIIRTKIDQLDSKEAASREETQKEQTVIGTLHVSLGSPLPRMTLDELEQLFSGDSAFHDLRKRLNKRSSSLFRELIRFERVQQIIPYQLLRVSYQSVIDWRLTTDLLHANSDFHHRPRYDFVIIQASNIEVMFAQILYVFGVTINNTEEHVALVLPFDETPDRQHCERDEALRFTHVQARHRSKATLINVESIDFKAEHDDEYIVMDVVDADLWWRMKFVSLARHVRM